MVLYSPNQIFLRDKGQLKSFFYLTAMPLGFSTLPLSETQFFSLAIILKWVLFDSFPLALTKVSLMLVLETMMISLRFWFPHHFIVSFLRHEKALVPFFLFLSQIRDPVASCVQDWLKEQGCWGDFLRNCSGRCMQNWGYLCQTAQDDVDIVYHGNRIL